MPCVPASPLRTALRMSFSVPRSRVLLRSAGSGRRPLLPHSPYAPACSSALRPARLPCAPLTLGARAVCALAQNNVSAIECARVDCTSPSTAHRPKPKCARSPHPRGSCPLRARTCARTAHRAFVCLVAGTCLRSCPHPFVRLCVWQRRSRDRRAARQRRSRSGRPPSCRSTSAPCPLVVRRPGERSRVALGARADACVRS